MLDPAASGTGYDASMPWSWLLLACVDRSEVERAARVREELAALDAEVHELTARFVDAGVALPPAAARDRGDLAPERELTDALPVGVMRQGALPALPAVTLLPAAEGPCTHRLELPALKALSDNRLVQRGLGEASPIRVAWGGHVLSPHAPEDAAVCEGALRHQGPRVLLSPPAGVEPTAEILVSLDPSLPIPRAGDGRGLFWVFPGQSLEFTVGPGWQPAWGEASLHVVVEALGGEASVAIDGVMARTGRGTVGHSQRLSGTGPWTIAVTSDSPAVVATLTVGNPQNARVVTADAPLPLDEQREAREAALHALEKAWSRATEPWIRPLPRTPPGYRADAPLPRRGDRPDVVLVSIDTLRADHLGAYGYERPTSPFLDELAAGGARYTQAWAPSSWTLPSHTTLLTGLLPDRHGVFEDHRGIGADLPWLPASLRAAGYRTGGVVSALYVSERFGFQRDFDHFEDFDSTDPKQNNEAAPEAADVFAHALHWAQAQPDGDPLFLFLHLYDVHYTYNPPEPFDTRFDRAARPGDLLYKSYTHHREHPVSPDQLEHQISQYDEEIAYVDDQLRGFVERWRAAGRELVIAVTSDHGEEFGERGSWGHAHTLYPEQLHVPLILAGPGITPAVHHERAGLEDLAVTLAALVGVEHPTGDGVDRSGQLQDGRSAGTSGAYAETSRFDTNQVRAHLDGLDLVVDLTSGRSELYDLAVDPRARHDLAAERPADAARLTRALTARFGAPWSVATSGTLTSKKAAIWVDGPSNELEVAAGARFAVVPPDGSVALAPTDGARLGPFSAVLGPRPSPGAALAYDGTVWQGPRVELDAAEQELLQELGYVQD